MENSASEFAERIAVSMYGGEKLTYDQVDKKVNGEENQLKVCRRK